MVAAVPILPPEAKSATAKVPNKVPPALWKEARGVEVPIPTLPPRKPKFWELMSMPVARDNCPPNWKSTVDSVNPLEAV